ncbi:MAG: PBP1A family penicillin-binding protein [Bacteriovoracaceae bacterium]|nr:PBP1A family penicillin-binding protein [Bacteriovoracaceae bacterium]
MKKNITRLIIAIISLGVFGGICATSILIYFSFDLPKISSLNDYHPAIPSKILSKDGTVLADLGIENREVAKFEEIPRRIIDAFLSAEDDSFYEHTGVDYMGVIRALVANLKAGRVVQGGSTITQQVAKSLLLSRERSITRKIKDFLLAQRIEEKFTKEEILFLYLNQVYLGGGYYGVKSAFEGYFGKSLSEATVAEASQVAGLLVAPGKYSPYVNPKRARIRQLYVLKRMFDTGKITKEEYEEAVNEKTQFRIRKNDGFKAGHFTDWVRQRVVSLVGNDNFLANGYIVQTSIDYELQKKAEDEILKTVKEVDKRQGFKGPLNHIEIESLDEWREKFLKDFYKSESTFFTLNNANEKEYELTLTLEELTDLKAFREEFRKVVKRKRFIPGTSENSIFKKYIKKLETYQGVVLSIDDWARIVYVDVGGVVGIIPYDGFRWAHERKISEERNFYPYVTKPSSILKVGDVVLVSVLDESVRLRDNVGRDYVEYIDKQATEVKKTIGQQTYLKLLLDQKPDAEGALVAMNPENGNIISLVGGSDFSKSQFNRAIQSKRQPGSSFKPILFAAALENGYTPASIIIDSPETLGGVDESLNWKPRNYDGQFKGPTTLRNSLEQSRNVPTVKIASDLGVTKILEFVDRIGLNADLDKDLSLALGSFGVTLMDLVSTYAVFPNGGKRVTPKSIISITDRFGSAVAFDEAYDDLKPKEKTEVVIAESTPIPNIPKGAETGGEEEVVDEKQNPFLLTLGGDQVYDSRLAYLMTNLLRGVVLHGTGRSAKSVSTFLGGKTGTTNNYVDAWFLGFSQNIVTGVWTGFDENQTLGFGETGAKAALPTWKEFMAAGLKKYGEYDFRPPQGIVNVLIDKETGKPLRPGNEKGFLESFVEGTEPGGQQETDEDSQQNGPTGPILEEDDYYNNQ